MKIKTGDLVYRKQHRAFNTPHDYQIWLATDICSVDGRVRIVNIHNGNVVSCKPYMLLKIETEEV